MATEPKFEELQRQELETFLLQLACNSQLKGMPRDYVFALMLNLHLGTWYNLMCDVLVYTEVEQ